MKLCFLGSFRYIICGIARYIGLFWLQQITFGSYLRGSGVCWNKKLPNYGKMIFSLEYVIESISLYITSIDGKWSQEYELHRLKAKIMFLGQ